MQVGEFDHNQSVAEMDEHDVMSPESNCANSTDKGGGIEHRREEENGKRWWGIRGIREMGELGAPSLRTTPPVDPGEVQSASGKD
jgi:hypothetical protein